VVAHLIGLLRREPRHRRALEAAAAALRDPDGSGGGDGGGAGGRRPAAVRGADAQRRAARRAALALLRASAADLPAASWHPGLEDGGEGEQREGGEGGGGGVGPEAARRLEVLYEGMGVDAGGRDPGRRRAALAQVLAAFRSGALGRYTLDDL
jgi:hypothetical protein